MKKEEEETFSLLVQDIYKKYTQKEDTDTYEKKVKRIQKFSKNTLLQQACSVNTYLLGLIYLKKFLEIKKIVTDREFKQYYTTCVALAAKMYEDSMGKIQNVMFYDKFVLVGEYILLTDYMKSEKEVLETLEYKLLLKPQDTEKFMNECIHEI